MNRRTATSQCWVHHFLTFRTQRVSWTLVSPALWTQLKLQGSKRATIKWNSTIQPFWRSSVRWIPRTCMQCLTLRLSSTESTTSAWVYWVQRRADTRNPSFANRTSSKFCNKSLSLKTMRFLITLREEGLRLSIESSVSKETRWSTMTKNVLCFMSLIWQSNRVILNFKKRSSIWVLPLRPSLVNLMTHSARSNTNRTKSPSHS